MSFAHAATDQTLDKVLTVCLTCGGPAYRETVTVTNAAGERKKQTWIRCSRKVKRRRWQEPDLSCPIQKEVIDDMGVFSEAIDGLDVKELAKRSGVPTWQKIARMKRDDAKDAINPETSPAREIMAAAKEMVLESDHSAAKAPMGEGLLANPWACGRLLSEMFVQMLNEFGSSVSHDIVRMAWAVASKAAADE